MPRAEPEEIRIDPNGEVPRTFEETRAVYRGRLNDAEIESYFAHHCRPVSPDEGARLRDVVHDPFFTTAAAAEAAGLRDVVHDPFLTAARHRGPGQPPPAGEAGLPDPNMHRSDASPGPGAQPDSQPPSGQPGAPQPRGRANVVRDPFLADFTGDYRSPFRMQEELREAREALKEAKKHWLEHIHQMLGMGDLNRRPEARDIMILAPWLLFVWVVMAWVLLQHFSFILCAMLVSGLALACVILVIMAFHGIQWGPAPLAVLGFLLLASIIAGTFTADIGWHNYWRQYWWLQTGQRRVATSAVSPAHARSDAAVLDFSGANFTSVDAMRAAGFRQGGNFYCVAPILDPASASAGVIRVNFWAVGTNCCQPYGSFTCDASRDRGHAYGVVMRAAGFTCADCDDGNFAAAVRKAEAMHSLVSAPGALYVRWVRNPSAVEFPLLMRAVMFLFLSALISLPVYCIVGYTLWYYGIGRRFGKPGDLSILTDGQRKQAV